MKKKGSLSLSINAIIVIVIAFVFLGLGLSFIRGQIGGADDTATMVQEQIKQSITEDLRTGDKKLSFPAQTLTPSRLCFFILLMILFLLIQTSHHGIE